MNTLSTRILWILKMAWRDSRKQRARLFVYMSAIILGVAALVAINSFGYNLGDEVENEGKGFLGADLVIRSLTPLEGATDSLLAEIGGNQSREASFTSMVFFPNNEGTRLCFIHALEGDYPYYGSLDVEPLAAIEKWRNGEGLLVDESMMLQFDQEIGDSVKLGNAAFPIVGKLLRAPGQAASGAIFAPRVYMRKHDLEQTGLIRFGSLVNYRAYIQLADGVNAEDTYEAHSPGFNRLNLRVQTAASRQSRLGDAMGDLYQFLNLTAFIALLLGAIGVASTIHVYIRQKMSTIAILRCLGSRSNDVFAIYLVQAFALGLSGTIIGILLGIVVQMILPALLGDFLVVDVDFGIAWVAVAEAAILGMGLTMLFALLPLLPVRRLTPLLTLRAGFEDEPLPRHPLAICLGVAIIVAITWFAWLQTGGFASALGFSGGTALAFALLIGVARLIMVILKRFLPTKAPYVVRQSLANLYRPQNQTTTLMLALGLGAFLLGTLYFAQHNLMEQIRSVDTGEQPNMVLFDIQPDQTDAIRDIVKSVDLPVLQEVPIVTARLKSIAGRDVVEIRDDTTSNVSKSSLFWEYRMTYRDTLSDTESLVAGDWIGEISNPSDSIFISVEERLSRRIDVGVGDEIVFDVQGVPITTYISSIREVHWNERVQPNFMIVFPRGVLEAAPQISVLVTRTQSPSESASIQREIVKQFPNVSIIDLTQILKSIDTITEKISLVIRFMALFSLFTGFIVLLGAVSITRFQKIKESVLLRTLGGTSRQITRIFVLEFIYIGTIASITGIMLALGAIWILSHTIFEAPFSPATGAAVAISISLVIATILVGMLNSRGIASRPPLEVLRSEG